MNELTRKAMLALLLAGSTVLPGRGAEPPATLCTGTAPTISVPAAWTDGETVPGGTPLVLNAHSLTGDTVTVTVDGLAATFAGGGGTFRWQPWTSGTHTLTHRAGTAVWTLRVSGAQSAAGLPAGAFRDCTNLVAVTLPSGLTEIGAGAFRGCANLVSVVFPSGLAGIGAGAFRDCANLVSVAFPSGLAEIGAGAFEGCPRLARVDVPALRDWFALSFADVDANPLTQGAALYVDGVPVRLEGPSSDRLVIPAGVVRIPAGAFRDCPDIVSVEIPPGVAEIAGGAFSGCTSLASVTVPADVLEMGLDGVFDVSTITNVVLGADVVRVRAGTFFCCPALRGVTIPSGVKGICDSAFAYCIGLEEVEIPSSVTSIGDAAFEGCTSLARVRLPRRFEGRLGPNVFAGCGGGPVLDFYDEARLPDSEVAVQDDGDAVGGTVTGGGTYAAGKRVVLKATAKKGYVFAGWELEGADLPEGADLMGPSLTLVAGGVDVTARARFIPVSEDWAEVGVAEGSASFAEEYATGGAFAPVTLAARGGSRAALKVAGLPAGLKFTAKALAVRDPKTKKTVSYPANTVYGTPTRSGIYTVAATATTAGGKTATARWTFAVRKPGERIARTAYNAEQGTVTGGGTYAAGKKVTLKATARKGYVFAGWELEGVALPEGADLQSPSLALVAGDADMTARARFIPVEEDWAEVSGTLPAECAKGAAIAPVTLAARGGSLVAVKVTGLPAGLKFTAKPLTVKATKTAPAASYPANTVYGTPTKSGVYTVAATATTAGRATAATNWTVVVRGPGERVVRTACDAAHGKVSGAGVYAKGKKAALKATAGKGWVFAGWELEGADLPAGADARDPSLALAVGESDVTARARFVPAGEDGTLALLVDGAEVPEDGSARFRDAGAGFALEAVSASLPKVALSGLPPGLKYDAKAGRIAGRGTKPGLYTVTAKLSNATVRRAVARTFRIEVPNLRDADALLRDGLANAPGEAYRAYVGVRAAGLPSLVPADPAHAKSLKVSGLPPGLKFDAKAVAAGEAALAGVPSKAGAYTVSVAVAGKTSTFTLEVLPLPDWAVGTFTGCFDETGADGTALRGTAAFTVSAAGKVSAKLVRQDGKAASWTHACLDRAEADAAGGVSFRVDAVVGGFRCDVSISAAVREGGPAQGVLAGTRRPVDAEDAGEGAVGLAFDCVQNLWGRGKALEGLAAKLKGRKVALPTIRDEQGNTYDVSLAFGAGGAVTAKYRLNGGAAQSASGTLAYRGAGELEAGGGEEDGEDGEGKTEQVAGSSVSLYLNLVRGGRAFLEVGLLVDGEGVVHWVDGRMAGDGEP